MLFVWHLFDLDTHSEGHSISFLVNSVPEWDNRLVPSWMVPGDDLHGVDLCKLNNIEDLQLLQFEEGVEDTVVELTEESERVSA